jgi:uncharacterized protein with NRDE domain
MCTIIAIFRLHPEYPLVVAANRDEFYERPAGGPAVLSEAPRSIGGIDLQEGGTWLGASERGLFAALTNQRTYSLPDPALRSRGQLVRRALELASPAEIADHLRGLDPSHFNPFNLLFGNSEQLQVAYAHGSGKTIEIEALPPGIHVLANDRIGSPGFPRAERARRAAYRIHDRPWPELVQALISILGDHSLPPLQAVEEPPPGSLLTREQLRELQAVCIHTEGYGTCSATLLALAGERVAHYLFAPGPPCRTAFQDVTRLL